MTGVRWWPRRAEGLPNGQRLLDEMPRFSDAPKRWAPAVPEQPELVLNHGDREVVVPITDLGDDGPFECVDLVADFHCVTTWSVRGLRWRGVRARDVVERAFGTSRPARFARVIAADGVSAKLVVEDLVGDDVLLATDLDGEPLTLRHGAPLRLVAPAHYGYKNAKHVTAIEFVDEEPEGAFGAKEHLRGRVALEERHSRLPNWLVRWPYRLAIAPTARWAEQSMRERPDGEPVRRRGAR